MNKISLNSIRSRLVLTTFAVACVSAVIFAAGLYMVFDTAEDKLFDEHIEADVETFLTAYRRDPSVLQMPRTNFRVYADRRDGQALPEFLVDLPEDTDEALIDGREFVLLTRELGAETLYFLFDESEFEEFERTMLLAMGVLILLVMVSGVWVGAMTADRIVRPLTELAAAVGDLDAGDTAPLAEAGRQADREIVSLGQAVNRYHERIFELLQREREFSADVSHELRTPIMAIQGAAEVLSVKFADQSAVAEPLNRIQRGCASMAGLTEGLLYLARDPQTFRDLIRPVHVREVVDDQITVVSHLVRRKGLRLYVEQLSDSTVDAIPAVISIVIGNILKNAVKYTNQNVINIFVEKGAVVVQDYGPGIDPDVQEALFQRFERGADTGHDGSGIGLALVRRFCEQYGWSVDLESKQGIGTRVAVRF